MIRIEKEVQKAAGWKCSVKPVASGVPTNMPDATIWGTEAVRESSENKATLQWLLRAAVTVTRTGMELG